MNVWIAVPIARLSCRVIIETSRAWSVVDEAILLAITSRALSLSELSDSLRVAHQVVVASLARLMRFRLVEVALTEQGSAFQLSDFGRRSVTGGNPLPVFPKRSAKRVNFVVDFATGEFFPASQVRIPSPNVLETEARNGREIRYIEVQGGGPSLSHDDNLARLSEIAARGWDEQVASVDPRTASLRQDEFAVFQVIDGVVQGLPDRAGQALRRLVTDAAAKPPGTRNITVTYGGPREQPLEAVRSHACSFVPEDLIIGGPAHRDCFGALLQQAYRRLIIHSTFLDTARFEALAGSLREACQRGVTIDLLWGDDDDDEVNPTRSAVAALEIAQRIRSDPDLRGSVRFHIGSTGSHAKILLLDTEHDGWVAVIGSCNWLASPFQSVEVSAVLRDPHVVADVCRVVQRMAGRRAVADGLAHELAITANDLRRDPVRGGPDEVAVVIGPAHEELVRHAGQNAQQRLVMGCHRLGSTARPGALMQGETAAGREVDVTVLYTLPSGPLKKRHARALVEEAAVNRVRLMPVGKIHLHGKFMAWDDDDLVVTSLNWTSSAITPDAPWNDIGVHILSPGIAVNALERLARIFPEQFAQGRLGATASRPPEGSVVESQTSP